MATFKRFEEIESWKLARKLRTEFIKSQSREISLKTLP